jgi:hypothetical protein
MPSQDIDNRDPKTYCVCCGPDIPVRHPKRALCEVSAPSVAGSAMSVHIGARKGCHPLPKPGKIKAIVSGNETSLTKPAR